MLETVRKEEEKKPKRLGSVQPKLCSVWHTVIFKLIIASLERG
jgi:hypothetical protein